MASGAPSTDAPQAPDDPRHHADRRITAPIYAAAALSGFTALGAEVVWTRQLSLLFGASVYTFSLILAVFLAGLGIGGLVGSRLARRTRCRARRSAWSRRCSRCAIAFGAWAIVNVLPHWQPTALFLPACASTPSLMFASTRCAAPSRCCRPRSCGAPAFRSRWPPAARGRFRRPRRAHQRDQHRGRARRRDRLHADRHPQARSARRAAGAGGRSRRSAACCCSSRFAERLACRRLGVIAVVTRRWRSWIVPAVPGQLIAYGRSVNSWDSIARFLISPKARRRRSRSPKDMGGAKQFHIAGKVEASDMDIDMRLERMLGHIPALLHPHPRSILIVGVGAGVTAGALSIHPEVERIVICEIEPVVPQSARAYFGNENHHVFDDPRVQLVFDDARHFLQTTNEKFDVITSDPIHPWVRGAATLYSLEYLTLAQESPHARRRRHAVDPAVRNRHALGEERDRHLREGVSRHDAVESRSARGRLRPRRARPRRANADQRGARSRRASTRRRASRSRSTRSC